MQGGRGKFLVVLLCLFSLKSFSQEIKVNGGFVEDSLLIGQDVNFWITATYPPQMEMVFPDSLYDFTPFEYAAKTFFPTQLRDQLAFDSTIYTVQSYEIDLVQYLQLQTVILNETDSTIINTPVDSIYLMELAPFATDTTELIANTSYSEVNRVFNYPLMYYIVGGFILVAVILLIVFGRRIIRFFKLRKLRKDYERFTGQLAGYIQNLKSDPKPDLAEEALFFWKRYQERLDKHPFTKLTTKEILSQDFTKELEKPLKSIDRIVYGKRPDETIYQDFQQIEDFTQYRYNKKTEDLKSGQDVVTESKKEVEEIASTRVSQFGLSTEQLVEELEKGGKFIIYHYVISILVLTFRRTSKVQFLKVDESGVKKGLGYTTLTFLLGWWGIPWGFIFTPYALFINLRGGKDVTEKVLQNAKNQLR